LHIHEAGQGVRPVARSLRPSEHLYLLHIEQGRNRADAAEVDIVNEKTDRRIWRTFVLLELAYAANLEIPRPVSVTGPVEVRYVKNQFLEVLYCRLLDRFAIEKRNGSR
jgi:hypothetical protein